MGCLFHVPGPSQQFPKFKRNTTNLVLEQAPKGSGHSSKPARELKKCLDNAPRHMVGFWGCPVQD